MVCAIARQVFVEMPERFVVVEDRMGPPTFSSLRQLCEPANDSPFHACKNPKLAKIIYILHAINLGSLLDIEVEEGNVGAVDGVFVNDLKEAEEAAVGRLLDGDQAVASADFGCG